MKWIRRPHKITSVKDAWALLNLLIVLVPVAVSLFVYISLYQIIVNTVNQDSISLLRQVQQETDARIADLQRVGIQVSSNAYVKGVLDVADVSNPPHYYDLSKIETDIFSYQTANGYIDSIVINFHSSGKLVSSLNIYDNALLDTGMLKETIMSSGDWEEIFKVAGTQRLIYIKDATGSGTGKMMYIQPISSGGPTTIPRCLPSPSKAIC